MNDALPKIKLSLINKKVLHGEFHEEQDGRIELHNAFFSDCPTFIFNISIRIEDIVFFIEDKETHYTNSIVGKFITDGEYAKGAASKKEEEDYVPQNYEKDGKMLVSDSDFGRIEDITIEHHETKACNGHTPLYDQIKENEKRFGVKIDFDESLYTSELDKESEFYKNNIERAKKIEQKILKDKKKVDLDDEERYSAVKTKECGIRRGSRNKTGSREEEKSALKHGKQVTDKSQNKEPMKIENVSINKDTTETVKMQSDDNKLKNNEKTWKKERSRKGIARKEGEENTSPVSKSKAFETATSELHKENVTKVCKSKSPTEIWSNFETESIKSINNTKIPFKVEGKEIISTKRVSYGKPNEGKYKSFDDLFNGIVENFKDNKETKKWAYVDDYRNFKGYAGEFHPYKYK